MSIQAHNFSLSYLFDIEELSLVRMALQEQAAQTDRQRSRCHNFWNFTIKYLGGLLSNLIIPLLLGIFTVFITIHQQNVATKQRTEDLQQAREQRIEDLDWGRTQHLGDRNDTQLQREQELRIASMERESQRKMATKRHRDKCLSLISRR